MRTTWHALHLRLLSHCHRATSEWLYQQVRARHPALSPTIDELLFGQQGPDGDPEHRKAVLRLLVEDVQTDGATSELASIILILALWPGLDAVHGRLCRDFAHERDELSSDILGRIAMGIRCLDLVRVNRVAATLVMNVERDIRRDLVRSRNRGSCETPWDDECTKLLADFADTDEVKLSPAEWQLRLLPLLGRDADLYLRIIVLGETQAQAGQVLGLTYAAARKRHQRALTKLVTLKINSADSPIRPQRLAFDKHEAADGGPKWK